MIRTNDPLAWQFNQQMVLENHSLFQCLGMLRQEGTDFLTKSKANKDEIIALIIKLVRLFSLRADGSLPDTI